MLLLKSMVATLVIAEILNLLAVALVGVNCNPTVFLNGVAPGTGTPKIHIHVGVYSHHLHKAFGRD